MRGLIIVGAIALLTGNLTAQSVRADHYLDIPGQSQTGTSGEGSFFPARNSLGGTSHPPPNPIRLTLLSVDRQDFVFGERFTYDVLIENTGTETIIVPWSPNRGAFVQPAPRIPEGFRDGSVFLLVESVDGKDLGLLDGQSLYGSDEVPGSLLRLAPGRTARIRVPGWWSAGTDEARAAMLRQENGIVHLRAVFATYVEKFPSKRSTNVIAVTVRAGIVQ